MRHQRTEMKGSNPDGFFLKKLGEREQLKDILIAMSCLVVVNLTGILSPSLNVDDYSQFGGDVSAWAEGGRWLLGPLFEWITLSAHAPSLLSLLGSILLAATGFVIALALGARAGATRVLTAVAFGGHPYFIDLMNFNTAVLAYPLAFLMAATAVLISGMGRRSLAIPIGALLFCFSLAIYQASLGLFASLFVLLLGFKIALSSIKKETNIPVSIWPLTLIGFFGLLSYAALTRFVVSSSSKRLDLISTTEDISNKFFYLYYSLQNTLLTTEVLLPGVTKVILFCLFLLAGYSTLSYAGRIASSAFKSFVFFTAIIAALFLALLAGYTPTLPVHTGLPPRAMLGHAVFTAAFIYLIFSFGTRNARLAGFVLSSILLFQYAIISNELMYKQKLLESLDMSMAASLHERISGEPGYSPGKKYEIVYLGEHRGPWRPQASVLQSAFERDWSRRDILRLHGLDVVTASANGHAWAMEKKERLKIWPAQGSILVTEQLIVVRFE